jgi:hypothetical protein
LPYLKKSSDPGLNYSVSTPSVVGKHSETEHDNVPLEPQ